MVALNYVAPWAQRRGVGRGLLRAIEQVAREAGHTACTLTSTVTAHGFYLACSYEDAGKPITSVGGKPTFPMRRTMVWSNSGCCP